MPQQLHFHRIYFDELSEVSATKVLSSWSLRAAELNLDLTQVIAPVPKLSQGAPVMERRLASSSACTMSWVGGHPSVDDVGALRWTSVANIPRHSRLRQGTADSIPCSIQPESYFNPLSRYGLTITTYAWPPVTSNLEGCHHQRVTQSPETKDKSDCRFLGDVLSTVTSDFRAPMLHRGSSET